MMRSGRQTGGKGKSLVFGLEMFMCFGLLYVLIWGM